MRSKERFKMGDYFETHKNECFGIWLDSNKSWDAVKLHVQRIHQSVNESSRGYISMKGRTIKEQYGETKDNKSSTSALPMDGSMLTKIFQMIPTNLA